MGENLVQWFSAGGATRHPRPQETLGMSGDILVFMKGQGIVVLWECSG